VIQFCNSRREGKEFSQEIKGQKRIFRGEKNISISSAGSIDIN
jgi:hypothetical protein